MNVALLSLSVSSNANVSCAAASQKTCAYMITMRSQTQLFDVRIPSSLYVE
jgi:hypothetical protein